MSNFKTLALSTVLLCATALTGCSKGAATQADDVQQTPAEHLLQRLTAVRDAGKVIFGHHDDTAYGHTWRYEADRSDVKDVVGDYPGLMNWDLGLVEWQRDCQLDSVPFDFIRQEVAKQDARGGINSISWHPRNPATSGDSWDTSYAPVHEMVTAGTALNDTLNVWLERAADFILTLKDKQGERIPVLFRPWHEHTGTWFWWGKDFCTPDDYKSLWHITRQVFDRKGVDNVLWVYSPDKIESTDEYTERYPGDDFVDILGTDVYHFNGSEGLVDYNQRVTRQLNAALELSQKNGKLIALSETGAESLPMDDWWSQVLLPICMRYPIVYVCVWRNAYQNPTHYYAPYKDQPSSASFINFYNNPKTLFASQLKDVK
jgi:mannan endo-1,4-beta-mannosidase